jgi:tRNA pseudouridine55 synthase
VDRAEVVAAIDPEGRLVAVLDESRSQARAKVVFVAG